MHLEGRNEVENRNGACVMEVALGSRAKMRAKEGGNKKKSRLEGSEAEALFDYDARQAPHQWPTEGEVVLWGLLKRLAW
jgi:hypothetical protein